MVDEKRQEGRKEEGKANARIIAKSGNIAVLVARGVLCTRTPKVDIEICLLIFCRTHRNHALLRIGRLKPKAHTLPPPMILGVANCYALCKIHAPRSVSAGLPASSCKQTIVVRSERQLKPNERTIFVPTHPTPLRPVSSYQPTKIPPPSGAYRLLRM